MYKTRGLASPLNHSHGANVRNKFRISKIIELNLHYNGIQSKRDRGDHRWNGGR